MARYCSEACQAADWPNHKYECARIRTEKLHAIPASPWEAAAFGKLFGKLSK